MNERIKIESEKLYLSHTHSLIGRMSERGETLSSVRERTSCGDHLFCFRVLLLPLVLILSLRKLWGFLLYGFPEENICVYCLLCLIVVLIVLSVKDPKLMLA